MLPSGPPNPIGGAQSLTRSNSALLGTGQQNPNTNTQQFSSLVPSSRAQFSNNSNHMNMLVNNIPNVSSLISNQSTSNALEPNSSINPVEAMQNYQQQQVLRSAMGNASNLASMKSEPQFDPQQLQAIRNLAPVKLEPNSTDPSAYFHQQQQQRIMQQRLIQLQHHQNQQLPHNKGLPPRSQLQNQQLQQSQHLQQNQQLQQNAQLRTQSKPNNYEPGVCPRRLTQYMYQQQKRPQDNSIGFWRSFVKEFFAPNAKKRWCVSQYGTGRHTTGVFPQDVWNCEICNQKPGRGFETTAEVLPRLCQIKYASGTLEELLYIDMPRESHNAMGQIVLDYPKAIQESVFEQLRVIRDGHLRIIFNPDLKIASWEFCARKHEELIPRRLLIPQVSQLGAVVQKYQNSVQNGSSPLSSQDLQSNCNGFVASARQVAKALEVPLVNDLGYTKRYVRCLQISEVVNSMKDLIDYSRQTGTGPMESLINFPRRNFSSSQAQQQNEQQHRHQNQNQTNTQDTSIHNNIITSENIMQLASNGAATANNYPSSNSNPMTTATTNSQQDNQNGHSNGPYGGANSSNMPQMPSTSSTGSLSAQAQNPSSRILHTSSHIVNSPQPSSQSSVNKILGMVSQMNNAGGGNSNFTGNEMKGNNGLSSAMNVGMSFGNMNGLGPSATTINTNNINGQRAAMMNNAMGMNGMAMNHHLSRINHQIQQQQQQDMGSRLMNNLGFNYSNNNHFDWKE